MIDLLDLDVKKRARQQKAIQEVAPLLALAGWEGRGLEAAVIAEARDPLLDAQLQAEASVAGSLAAQQTGLQHAGTCLDEMFRFSAAPNALDGLDADLSNLFCSFETLSADPANLPLRRGIVQSARDVAAKLNGASARLGRLRADLNASIQQDVVRVNQSLGEIALLNQQILQARASGGGADALAQQRRQILQELSGWINLCATPRPDGGVNVSIGGVAMVSGTRTPDTLATYPDPDNDLRLQAQDAGRRLKPSGGSIAGKIHVRDDALAALQSGLNHLAAHLISRFNSIYKSAGGPAGRERPGFFTGADASDIAVNPSVAADPSRLRPVRAVEVDGNGALAPALETFGQSYAQTVSNLGRALGNVSDDLSASQAMAQMLANERKSDRGVSIGGELICLQRYEEACAASARMQAALNDLPPMH